MIVVSGIGNRESGIIIKNDVCDLNKFRLWAILIRIPSPSILPCYVNSRTMTEFLNIDVENSIASGYIRPRRIPARIIDSISFFVLCVMATIVSISIFRDLHIDGELTAFGYYVCAPVLFVFGTYGIYRILLETKLTCINSNMNIHDAHETLMAFLKKGGYDTFLNKRNLVVVTEESTMSFNNTWIKVFTFIIENDKIYFNVVKRYPKGNPPVFFTQLILAYDLERLFSKKVFLTNT